MDYVTKSTNRKELRLLAKLFRSIMGLTQNERIDPVALLEKLPDTEAFNDVTFEVVDDTDLPHNVPAECIKTEDGYHIRIKESVYNKAHKENNGACRMHILHEIMHTYADKVGFQPVFTRVVYKKIPPYKSLEWIVMALAGEVMMPYEETESRDIQEIIDTYGVSTLAAVKRKKY